MSDWKKDTSWRLVSYSPSHWEHPPTLDDLGRAELCGDGCWASVIEGGAVVATWQRLLPLSERERKTLRAKADRIR